MPFEIPQPANATAWQLATSNLVFAYRPNPTLKRVDRDKFNFLKNDYGTDGLSALNLSKEATGSWGMARAEISFQENDTPDLWHTNWSSRMRPVALSGEWGSPTIGAAGMDALPYLAVGGSLSGIFSGGASTAFTDMAQDGLRFIMSMEALKGGRTAGLAR
jgi:hypothetical protein